MVSQQEYDALRKNLDRTRALKNNCQVYLKIWQRMAVSDVSITKEYGESIVNQINQYAGSNERFDVLGLPGQLMSSISWDEYPADSFTELIDNVKKISLPLAQSVEEHGVSYSVLGLGDKTRASVWENPHDIYIDTEEWYESIPENKRIWNDDAEIFESLSEAIALFESELIEEVKSSLKEDFDITLKELYELLG